MTANEYLETRDGRKAIILIDGKATARKPIMFHGRKGFMIAKTFYPLEMFIVGPAATCLKIQ